MKYILKISKLIFINLLIFITLIFLLEISFFVGRKILNKNSVGLFFTNREITKLGDDCNEFISHPFYGHVHAFNDCDIRGGYSDGPFVFYDNFNESFPSILVFGGSTTDGVFQHVSDGYTWSYYLNEIFKKNQIDINVINGGVGAYNSQKELLKLMIDGRKLNNIKTVISLNGINDKENYNNLPTEIYSKFPFFSDKQFEMYYYNKYINQKNYYLFNFFPNIQSFVKSFISINNTFNEENDFFKSINSSVFKSFNSTENWKFSINLMNYISDYLGSEYYVFLQPTMGLNDCQIPTDNKTDDYEIYHTQITEEYLNDINLLYKSLRKECKNTEFCYDISCIARPNGNNYSDIRHHNKNGNLIIAENIFEIIKANL